jgi:hypothetical protein
MRGADNQQLAVDNPRKKPSRVRRLGDVKLVYLLNLSVSHNDRRQFTVDPASIMPQSSSKSFCV